MSPIAATAVSQPALHPQTSGDARAFADWLATADALPAAATRPAAQDAAAAVVPHPGAREPDAATAATRGAAQPRDDAAAGAAAGKGGKEKKTTGAQDTPDAPAQTSTDVTATLPDMVAWMQAAPLLPPPPPVPGADPAPPDAIRPAEHQAPAAALPSAAPDSSAPLHTASDGGDVDATATATGAVPTMQPSAAADLVASMAGAPLVSAPAPAHDSGPAATPVITGGTSPAVPQAGTAMVSLLQTPSSGPQVILQLAPEALGAVTVTISRDDRGQTSVTFTASEPDTLHALAAGQHDLHALIHDAGLPAADHKLHFELAAPQAVSAAAATDTANNTDFSAAHHGFNDSFTSGDQNASTPAGAQADGGTDGGTGDSARGNAERGQRQATGGAGAGGRGEDTVVHAAARYRTIGAVRPVNITV